MKLSIAILLMAGIAGAVRKEGRNKIIVKYTDDEPYEDTQQKDDDNEINDEPPEDEDPITEPPEIEPPPDNDEGYERQPGDEEDYKEVPDNDDEYKEPPDTDEDYTEPPDYHENYDEPTYNDYDYKEPQEDDAEEEEPDKEPVAVTCECGLTNKGRIMGGSAAGRNEYPMMVNLILGMMICGGTIITPWHVLTAAHCAVKVSPSACIVFAGTNYLARSEYAYGVSKIVLHEGYEDNGEFENDIAILVTSGEMLFNRAMSPVCMPTKRVNLVGQFLTAMGWGTVNKTLPVSDVLNYVALRVVKNVQCHRIFKNDLKTTFCTRDYKHTKDTGQGDSGGPLLMRDPETDRYTVYGLVSYGAGSFDDHNYRVGNPGVTTDVTAYLHWIDKVVEETKPGTLICRKVEDTF